MKMIQLIQFGVLENASVENLITASLIGSKCNHSKRSICFTHSAFVSNKFSLDDSVISSKLRRLFKGDSDLKLDGNRKSSNEKFVSTTTN